MQGRRRPLRMLRSTAALGAAVVLTGKDWTCRVSELSKGLNILNPSPKSCEVQSRGAEGCREAFQGKVRGVPAPTNNTLNPASSKTCSPMAHNGAHELRGHVVLKSVGWIACAQ